MGALIWVLSAVILLGYLLLVYFLILKTASPFVRKLITALTITAAGLAALHSLTWLPAIAPFWRWFLDLNAELALGTMFSSTLLLIVGLSALITGLRAQTLHARQRAYWLLLAVVFIGMSLDEYYHIHETIGSVQDFPLTALQHAAWLNTFLLLLGSAWRTLYVTIGLVVVTASVSIYYFGAEREIRFLLTLLVGIALLASGGLLIDILTWDYFRWSPLLKPVADRFVLFEEFLEMGGAIIVLGAIVSYGQAHLSDGAWRSGKRVAAIAGGLWIVWLLTNLWPRPYLESRLVAEPIQADYFGDSISLAAYRLSKDYVTPGDELTITLYWRANRLPPEQPDLKILVRVLSQPAMQIVTRADRTFDVEYQVPLEAWLPGVPVRQTVRLRFPEDLPVPASYPLMVRLSSDDAGEIDIAHTDRRLIAPDTLILTDIPALPSGREHPSDVTITLHFEDEVTLEGYTLPEESRPGETLPLTFNWRTEHPTGRHFIQFLHVFNSEGEALVTHDQEPFDGVFPSTDWPPGVEMTDEWALPLPEDLPPGEYDVYTGLYEWPSLERLAVVDDRGNPVENNSIYLGTFTFTP
jgi:hypothetical protein